MPRDVSVESDRFAAAISQILDNVKNGVETGIKEPVRDAGKTARREWRSNWNGIRKGRSSGPKYAQSISYTVKDRSGDISVEIGSKTMPGLPHLLELGHATVGGGFVPGRPHISPAADTAMEQFEKDVEKAVQEAIEQA